MLRPPCAPCDNVEHKGIRPPDKCLTRRRMPTLSAGDRGGRPPWRRGWGLKFVDGLATRSELHMSVGGPDSLQAGGGGGPGGLLRGPCRSGGAGGTGGLPGGLAAGPGRAGGTGWPTGRTNGRAGPGRARRAARAGYRAGYGAGRARRAERPAYRGRSHYTESWHRLSAVCQQTCSHPT